MPRQQPLFEDRRDAGLQLAQALAGERTDDAVAAGLARGGVVVAAEVARALGLPLDVVAVRKVGHPFQPEYALGAVAPSGAVYLRDQGGLRDDELAGAVARATTEAEELEVRLREHRPPVDLAGRACVLVDDGLATGATMIAAILWARERGAARVVAAVPVAAARSADAVREETDAFVCPHELEDFWAVGLWYRRFGQVDDDDVVRLLAEAERRANAA